ncbi:hypothetical protein EDD11_004659 [Mortierella claussenii]|nr:hypothetical protein EDD11_004659 [Mortierella claussenii]
MVNSSLTSGTVAISAAQPTVDTASVVTAATEPVVKDIPVDHAAPTPDTLSGNDSLHIQHPSHPHPKQQHPYQQQQLHHEPNNPQLILHHQHPFQDLNDSELNGATQPPRDAWAHQGHFPLTMSEISHQTIPVRGGCRVILSGVNFREGVEVMFECPQLKNRVEAKVITPRVLKSTEMEITTPCLLDWWAMANSIFPRKELVLSVSLLCAGSKDEEDMDTTFEMVTVEDSETELLHIIINLHRQLVQTSLSSALDPEAEKAARQRTLTLLDLEQPPSVSRSEHLALGVIYMLCDAGDQISSKGMSIIRAKTFDGHDMLHLAVLQGQTTLVREIARHLLAWFQTHAITAESELFTRDSNGHTALDFARVLGRSEIEHVLAGTLEAAQEFKKNVLRASPRPIPSVPAASRPLSIASLHPSPMAPVAEQVLNRPLPPTPLCTPFHEPGNGAYFPIAASSEGTMKSQELARVPSRTVVSSAIAQHSSPQRVQTAIMEDGSGSPKILQPASLAITNMIQQAAPVVESPENTNSLSF